MIDVDNFNTALACSSERPRFLPTNQKYDASRISGYPTSQKAKGQHSVALEKKLWRSGPLSLKQNNCISIGYFYFTWTEIYQQRRPPKQRLFPPNFRDHQPPVHTTIKHQNDEPVVIFFPTSLWFFHLLLSVSSCHGIDLWLLCGIMVWVVPLALSSGGIGQVCLWGVSGYFLCLGRFRLTFGGGYLMLPVCVCVCVCVRVCVWWGGGSFMACRTEVKY